MLTPNRLLSLTVCLLIYGTAHAGEPTANLRDGVVLYGYDPVSYFKADQPQKGSDKITAESDGIKYYFVSDESRKEFLKDPKHYAPAYEGWCATAVANGIKYDIDPKNYKITGGRLFLFYKGWKGDAKKEWVKDEPAEITKADSNWAKVRLMKE